MEEIPDYFCSIQVSSNIELKNKTLKVQLRLDETLSARSLESVFLSISKKSEVVTDTKSVKEQESSGGGELSFEGGQVRSLGLDFLVLDLHKFGVTLPVAPISLLPVCYRQPRRC